MQPFVEKSASFATYSVFCRIRLSSYLKSDYAEPFTGRGLALNRRAILKVQSRITLKRFVSNLILSMLTTIAELHDTTKVIWMVRSRITPKPSASSLIMSMHTGAEALLGGEKIITIQRRLIIKSILIWAAQTKELGSI